MLGLALKLAIVFPLDAWVEGGIHLCEVHSRMKISQLSPLAIGKVFFICCCLGSSDETCFKVSLAGFICYGTK